MFNLFRKDRKVTLVLGGGSARGMAHIGVLKVLEREGVSISSIIGTSMGALVGAGYALGVPLSEIEEMAYKFSINKLLDPVLPRMSLLGGEKLEAYVREIYYNKSFKDCKIPMHVVTTDIETNEDVVHSDGDLAKVIRASCSWPGILKPVNIDGRLLVDGGIKYSVPTKVAKDLKADYIIAVDVGFCVKYGKIDNIFQMILQSFQIMGHELNKLQAKEADIVIEVLLDDLDQLAFNRAREAVAAGAKAAEAKIAEIKRDLRINRNHVMPVPAKAGKAGI